MIDNKRLAGVIQIAVNRAISRYFEAPIGVYNAYIDGFTDGAMMILSGGGEICRKEERQMKMTKKKGTKKPVKKKAK